MRHGKRNNALGRKTAHRKAMLENMACSLIEHKRINTTVAKAKELRKFVEPIITRSKEDSTHNRREAFKNLQSKNAVTELFREVAPKVAKREGGYTRIIKLGTRMGDAAEMAMIELVDFNELMLKDSKTKTRRSRRGGKKKDTDTQGSAATAESAKSEEPKVEEAKADTAPAADAKETAAEKPAPKAEEPKAEKSEEPKKDENKDEGKKD
ncbi:MAG TPA: 50S ribosomal protein L17 [Cryomorphaceae bacterium]|nr:50S ribosomal protein L17 [Cryomorphaceae bacterium]